MRTLRVLASLHAVFFFIFVNAGEAAEEGEALSVAARKVPPGPQLLNFLAKPETSVQQGVEASAAFVRNVLNGIVRDKDAMAAVERAINLTISQLSDRTETLTRMAKIAKQLEEGGVGQEEREKLQKELKDLAEHFKSSNNEMLAEGLGAIGVPEAQVQEIMSNGLLSRLASLLENAALAPFQKYLQGRRVGD